MIDLDRGIFLSPKERPAVSQPLSKPIANLLQIQDELLKQAQARVQAADDAHYASASPTRTEFAIGAYVLLDHPVSAPSRLHARRKGPYQVVRFHQNDYTIRNLVNHKESTVNIKRLTPFDFDPQRTDPRQVAMADDQEFEIEDIIAHRGNLNQKSTLEFRVRWLGYDESADTWEPWKNVRTTEQLHRYLKNKGLQRHIPPEFLHLYKTD